MISTKPAVQGGILAEQRNALLDNQGSKVKSAKGAQLARTVV